MSENNTFGEMKEGDSVYVFESNQLEKVPLFSAKVVDNVKKILFGCKGYTNAFFAKLNATSLTIKVLSKYTNKPAQAKVFVNKSIALEYLNKEINSLVQQTNILSDLRTKIKNDEI